MNTTTPRPTPETDALAVVCYGEGGIEASHGFRAVPIKDCRRLERERDEARDQLEAMREAIKKGYDALTGCVDDSGELLAEHGWWKDEPRCGYQLRYEENKQRIENAKTALAKLQPFIKTLNLEPK